MSIKDLGAPTGIPIMTLVSFVIILFLGVSVLLILIHICIVGRAFRAIVRDTEIERESTRTISMSQDDLDKLPCYNYVAKSKESSANCAVCLENFEEGDKCRLLPMCKHSFHAHCVDTWLLKRPICPICRTMADSRRLELIADEESSHFSDTSTEVRGSQTTESSQFSDASLSTELRDGLPNVRNHLMSVVRPDVSESHGGESSDVIVELEQSQEENNQCIIAQIESTQKQPTAVPALDSISEPLV